MPQSRKKTIIFLSFLILLFIMVSSCSSIAYYAHTINGHLNIMQQRQDIDEILVNSTDENLNHKLKLALVARAFASDTLGLPKNNSYKTYVDIKKPYVVWNVVATPEFSFEPKQWCFLVVGCVQYRGYYTKEKALQQAAKLQKKGLDVSISGAIAYSTLGWFDDPLLNTMVQWSDAALAEFIFHELAHQQIYIKGDSEFNEAFATTVGEQGTEIWLEKQTQNLEKYKHAKQLYQKFLSLIQRTRQQLEQVYATSDTDSQKRQQKAQVLQQLRDEFSSLKQNEPLYEKFDYWFQSDLNNAKFALISTYRDLVPAFREILRQEGSFEKFYAKVKSLGKLPLDKRHTYLQSLLQQVKN